MAASRWPGSTLSLRPADSLLAGLRDEAVYQHINAKGPGRHHYPPGAQLIFLGAVALHDSVSAMRAIMTGFEVVTVVALMAWMHVAKLPLSRVLIYAWHPLPIWEFASQAHLDAAVTTFLCLGILAAIYKRQSVCGALFACATLIKFYPVILLPALGEG